MNFIFKGFSAIALSLSAVTAFAAAPKYLTTHNNTNVESNAFVAGTIPSAYPTPADSTREIYWTLVKVACYGHTVEGKCPALIKVATNTSSPVEIGMLSMDLSTGDITPKQISKNGYTVTINGPGEATITKD